MANCKLAKNIEDAFGAGDTIIQVVIRAREADTLLYEFYYTLVNAKLKKMGEQLGNYRHAMKSYRSPEDGWWVETRRFFENVYVELEKASVGTLLGVPLHNTETGRFLFSSELMEGETREDVIQKIGGAGTPIKLEVVFWDDVPEELLPSVCRDNRTSVSMSGESSMYSRRGTARESHHEDNETDEGSNFWTIEEVYKENLLPGNFDSDEA